LAGLFLPDVVTLGPFDRENDAFNPNLRSPGA
jgi:hypothetical protein